jgi:hypothetical protein
VTITVRTPGGRTLRTKRIRLTTSTRTVRLKTTVKRVVVQVGDVRVTRSRR